MMKVEMHDVHSFVGCFWNFGNSEWGGVLSKFLENMDVSIIKTEHAILLLRKEDFDVPVQSSSENNRVPR